MECYTCHGRGYVTCPNCGGKGSYWTIVGNHNEWEPCCQCGGKREVQCQTCPGRRVVPDSPPIAIGTPVNPLPPPLPPDPALLKLTGRWKGGGGRYEFVSDNGGYRVTVFNLFGWETGSGQATIVGSTLTLTIKTLGTTNTADLRLDGGRLQGVMRILGGLPMPFVLRRV
jgi:hypothetical protein